MGLHDRTERPAIAMRGRQEKFMPKHNFDGGYQDQTNRFGQSGGEIVDAGFSRALFADCADDAFTRELISVSRLDATIMSGSKLRPDQLGKSPALCTPAGWKGFAGWGTHATTRADVQRWVFQGANLGLRNRYFPAVDIDIDDERQAALIEAIQKLAFVIFGWAPVRIGRPPKRLLLYRLHEGEDPIGKRQVRFEVGGKVHLIELLTAGQQCVVEGMHPCGRPYTWSNPHPCTVGSRGLTPITADQVDRFFKELAGC
jgi:hypothetical protein